MNEPTEHVNNDRVSEEVEEFVSDLVQRGIDEGVLEGAVEAAFDEECRYLTELERPKEDSTEESEVTADHETDEHAEEPLQVAPFHERLLSLIHYLTSPRIMVRFVVIGSILLLCNSLYTTIRESMAQPHVQKARAAKPFFSNATSKFMTDYYTGNMKPEWLLKKTDLLFVMYYAPWSTHSVAMAHPFSMASRLFEGKDYMSFAAINCWTVGGACRQSYKITTFPMVVAYSNTVSLAYTGEPTGDHMYKWIKRLAGPLEVIKNDSDLRTMRSKYQHVVVGYFPFKNMQTPDSYQAYAAAAFLLNSGSTNDYSTVVCLVTSLEFARELGIRFEGDIQLFRATESKLVWPGQGAKRTAEGIVSWVRTQRDVTANVQWINHHRNFELSSTQFATLLNETAVLLLALPYQPVYHRSQEITILTKMAHEYWTCDEDDLLSSSQVVVRMEAESQLARFQADKEHCQMIENLPKKLPYCCRSIFRTVDWNMACASSAKYRWENATSPAEEDSTERRRNHWTEQRIPQTEECEAYIPNAANELIVECCAIYDDLTIPTVSRQQKIMSHRERRIDRTRLVDRCINSKVAEYYHYDLEKTTLADEENPDANHTVQGFGCVKNDSLRFALLDTRHSSFFLRKWGLNKTKAPLVIAIDTAREHFSVMEGNFTQKSLRSFIRRYHKYSISEHLLDENMTKSKFRPANESKLWTGSERTKEKQTLGRLDRHSIMQLIEAKNLSSDHLVFFSGGNWHAPSTAVLHVMHTVARYFDESTSTIKFHVIDTSRNEMPYNFNFERLPALVLFLSDRRDVSWKYPDSLPVSVSNLLSFVLSRCSANLRWRTAIFNCDSNCASRNLRRMRRHSDVIMRDIHSHWTTQDEPQSPYQRWKQHRITQLSALRSALRVLYSISVRNERISSEEMDRILDNQSFEHYFVSLRS